MDSKMKDLEKIMQILDAAREAYLSGTDELAKFVYGIAEPDVRQLLFGALQQLFEMDERRG